MQKGTKTVIRMDNTRHISDPFELITLENILSQANMLAALKRVEANKGAPGIDGMETTQLREHLFLHPGELSSAIRNGTYKREFRSNLYCVDENSWARYANSVVDDQLFLRSLSQAR